MAVIYRQIHYGGYMQTNSICPLYTEKFNMADIRRQIQYGGYVQES